MQYLGYYQSPLGDITIASDGEHLTGLLVRRPKVRPRYCNKRGKRRRSGSLCTDEKVAGYLFSGERPGFHAAHQAGRLGFSQYGGGHHALYSLR